MPLSSHLVPTSRYIYGFTTCPYIDLPNIQHISLEDKSLGIHKVASRTTHELVTPPAISMPNTPKHAWEAVYPTGSTNPRSSLPGGFGFYLSGPRINGAQGKESIWSYRMMLQDGWEWVKGGKFPGIFGGSEECAYGCTGGRQETREKCFNVRIMWRANGKGELYAYVPFTQNNRAQLLAVPPKSSENTDYGFSVGRGAFFIPVGKWVSIAIRVKVGDGDGELELWVDGKSVISVSGLTLPETVRGMHFQTFFGGHTPDWAPKADMRAWFADVTSVVIL